MIRLLLSGRFDLPTVKQTKSNLTFAVGILDVQAFHGYSGTYRASFRSGEIWLLEVVYEPCSNSAIAAYAGA